MSHHVINLRFSQNWRWNNAVLGRRIVPIFNIIMIRSGLDLDLDLDLDSLGLDLDLDLDLGYNKMEMEAYD